MKKEHDYRLSWKTKDGKSIEYRRMTTSHLENTYNMLERMVCNVYNKTYDIDELYIPDWVDVAMTAIEKELCRRDLKQAQKLMED